jgi:integrase/recombinase XerD
VRSESEALHLQWPHLVLEQGFLWIASNRVHRTKGGKGRWVPTTARLRDALDEHVRLYRSADYKGRSSAYVFHHERTRRHHQAGAPIRSFRRAFQNAQKDAAIGSEFHPHDLRRRRVTTWLAEGRDIVHVKEAVGHADLRTMMDYTHLARKHLRSLREPPQ